MKKIQALAALFFLAVLSGCSINHPIAEDYGQYLDNNAGSTQYPQADIDSQYQISKQTQDHRYEFRAATVGYAHLWIVEFGQILDQTLKSSDVQKAFGKLEPQDKGANNQDYLITFDLENYEFKNHMAHVALNIALEKNGNNIFSKSYQAQGKSQGGKMFWGGPFAMKNATQQSTKLAIDEILADFINDIKKQ